MTGEKRAERAESCMNYYFSERVYGRFRRTFQVPDDGNLDKVGAVLKDGAVTITIPKRSPQPSEGRRIPVSRG